MPYRPSGPAGDAGKITSLKDVALAAGVSTATVSRVLNSTAVVSQEIRQRVERACDAMGYVPNGAARALSSRRTQTIGAIIPTIENDGFARGISALQRQVHAAGYTLLLASSDYCMDAEMREVRKLVAHGIDGLMLVGGEHHPEVTRLLANKRIPSVNTWVLADDLPSVGFDNVAAARRLTDHLLDLDHRRIAIIAGRTPGNDRAAARVAGTREAMERRDLPVDGTWLVERSYRIDDGRQTTRELLSAPAERRPTAIICGNDQLAFAALIEAQLMGLHIPRDVSIAGFNDADYAAFLQPPLTTIHIPSEEIGRQAADYLLAEIAGRSPPLHHEIAIDLIIRESTGPAPTP